MWIDTHCHLDATEFAADRMAVAAAAASKGVSHILLPAVARENFQTVCDLAHNISGAAYALGIHPLYVPQASEADLVALEAQVAAAMSDERFVAIGEIGLDFFVPELCTEAMRAKQMAFYLAQLKLAKRFQLPVILHVRRSQDALLKGLRQMYPTGGSYGGIAHAFNGSAQQATQFIEQGFALGFGGAMTFPKAEQIRRLAASVPETALVLETDAPDIPPHWLYTPAAERTAGTAQGRNTPSEIPAIAAQLAELRGMTLSDLAVLTQRNVQRVLPRWQLGKT